MTNFAHVLGFIILVLGFIMAVGTGHVKSDQRTGAFTLATMFVVFGEVLSRL